MREACTRFSGPDKYDGSRGIVAIEALVIYLESDLSLNLGKEVLKAIVAHCLLGGNALHL